ncbi:MAG: hypothetical protein AAGA99_12405 [Actinomycetota bacterium]
MLNRLDPTVADHLATIWRARRIVIVVALLAAAISLALSASSEERFESTSLLQIGVDVPDDGEIADFRAGVIAEIAGEESFRLEMAADTGLPLDDVRSIDVSQAEFPGFVEVSASADNPEEAETLVGAMVDTIVARDLAPGEEAVGLGITPVGPPVTVEPGNSPIGRAVAAYFIAGFLAAEAAVVWRFMTGGLSPRNPADDLERRVGRPAARLFGEPTLDVAAINSLLPFKLDRIDESRINRFRRTDTPHFLTVRALPQGNPAEVGTPELEPPRFIRPGDRPKLDSPETVDIAVVPARPDNPAELLRQVAENGPFVIVEVPTSERWPHLGRWAHQLETVGARSVAFAVVDAPERSSIIGRILSRPKSEDTGAENEAA